MQYITNYTAFVVYELLKEGLLKVFEIAKANNCNNIIYDNSEFKGASSYMQNRVNETYFKEMVNSGIAKCALIKSKDKFALYSVENVIKEAKKTLETEIFETVEQAILWLKQ